MKRLVGLVWILAVAGCPDIQDDGNETESAPVVEFDPSASIVPFPNNLLLNPMTGKVNVPASCNESATTKAIREGVLNTLDGFGVFEAALTVTFSEPIDPASLRASDGSSRVLLYKRAAGTTPVDPATAQAVPVVTRVGSTVRFSAATGSCVPSVVPQLAIIPAVPLDQKSTYVVALVEGITTASGAPLRPSSTWRLVRAAENPVTIVDGVVVADRTPLEPDDAEDLARLQGIDLLWKAHAQAMKFLTADLPAGKAQARDKVLLAWEFRTQTTTDPLDPAVAGSPASEIDTATGITGSVSVPSVINRAALPYSQCPTGADGDSDLQCFLKISLGQGNYTAGNTACAQVGCAEVGDVITAKLASKQYQVDTPNAYTGPGARAIPGPWGNPLDPAEVKVEQIDTLVVVPAAAAPTAGYPVVVFQHGLGRSRNDAIAIASQLAVRGFATVAIDAVAHGARAVRISNDAARGCADTAPSTPPNPSAAPQCYAPFLSPNLGGTRDNIRQTSVDQQRLVAALKSCGAAGCGALKVNAASIVYMGQSLGGILGNITTSVATDVKASVLNVPGVGWLDVLENTQTLDISCALVDGLIDAGVLQGQKLDRTVTPPTGLCTTPEWKTQAGYVQFSVIARWVLDPADPANFTRKLATRRFLIQEVVGDTVVPNVATGNQGALVGLMPATADRAASVPPPPSAAITTNQTTSKWVRYPTLADGGTGMPGNTFGHGSLLSPVQVGNQPPTLEARLATARMQTDAITYLVFNR